MKARILAQKSRILAGGATIAVIIAAGQFMENDAYAALPTLNDVPALPGAPLVARSTQELPRNAQYLASRIAQLDSNTQPNPIVSDVSVPAPLAFGCAIDLTAMPASGAMVSLGIDAPCLAGQSVTVRHAGLSFGLLLDGAGHRQVDVPVMSAMAEFDVTAGHGRSYHIETEVFTLDGYHRVALNWTGETGLGLHALENGASYASAGHVHAGAARDPMFGVDARGGFLTRLGDAGTVSGDVIEVYSYPADRITGVSAPVISIEAEIFAQNCDRPFSGNMVMAQFGDAPISRDFDISAPGCDAIGDFLVMKNLIEDLKFVQN